MSVTREHGLCPDDDDIATNERVPSPENVHAPTDTRSVTDVADNPVFVTPQPVTRAPMAPLPPVGVRKGMCRDCVRVVFRLHTQM